MKAYSWNFKVVLFVFLNNENFPSYDVLNGHRYSKSSLKVKYLMSLFWEAIQVIAMKFFWNIYDQLGYPHTKFCTILRESSAKLW